MKAVLARSLEPGRFIDLSHELPVHGVKEAAFVVRAMARGFPPGTIHVVVVDPGVGGRRAPLVLTTRDGSLLVGPDNGVLYPLAELLGVGPAYRIDPARLRQPPRVGTTFDGRDVFAPAAAELAAGRRPSDLGPPFRPTVLSIPDARQEPRGAQGEVVHTDRFGNLITNVPSDWVPTGPLRLMAALGAGPPRHLPWATSYEAIGSGRAGALASSFGTVEIAVAEGRADRRFRARVGTRVRLRWARDRTSRVRA
jgi:hypothetical protein